MEGENFIGPICFLLSKVFLLLPLKERHLLFFLKSTYVLILFPKGEDFEELLVQPSVEIIS